ncbi:MAG: ABC transporter permease [Actinomycetota bacterium]|nr:ABC transporter permease [Actinomycetota bacterium]MDQ2956879.1 ABC transporter permease [Actinomycetota bacterium]
MLRYVLNRIGWAVPVLVGVTIIVFVLVNIVPGSPIHADPTGVGASPAEASRLRAQFGLNRPIWIRYLSWIGHLSRGDFGNSFRTHQPVLHEILSRLPSTLQLAAAAYLITLIVAVPVGIVGAVREDRASDRFIVILSVIGHSVPVFWAGLASIVLFATRLRWFPAGGDGPVFGGGLMEHLRYLVLPAVTMAIPLAAEWMRYARGQLIDILPRDFVLAARAKGASERVVVLRHAWRNALVPLVQLAGLSLPTLFSGALISETVFNRSGIGRLAYDSAVNRDYPTVLGAVVFVSALVILGNLLADVAGAVIDPRIRLR